MNHLKNGRLEMINGITDLNLIGNVDKNFVEKVLEKNKDDDVCEQLALLNKYDFNIKFDLEHFMGKY